MTPPACAPLRTKKPKLPLPTEHQEQTAFFARVDLDPRTRDLLIYAVPNFSGHVGGRVARLRAGKRLKDEGRRAGVPDICVDEPRLRPMAWSSNWMSSPWHGLRIEMKRKGNSPTPEQKRWIKALTLNGYQTLVCYTAEEAWTTLCAYLGLTEIHP